MSYKTCEGIGKFREFHHYERHDGGFYSIKVEGLEDGTSLPAGAPANILLFIPEDGLNFESLGETVQVVSPDITLRHNNLRKREVIEIIENELMPEGLVQKVGDKFIRTEKANKGLYEFHPMSPM